MHPVHTFPPYFPKIHSNIIFPSTPMSTEWSVSLLKTTASEIQVSNLKPEHAKY